MFQRTKAHEILNTHQTIDQVIAFHGQLLALEKMGIPVDIGVSEQLHAPSVISNQGDVSLSESLHAIQMHLSSRSGLSDSVDAICRDPQYPQPYRLALLSWVRGTQESGTQESSTQESASRPDNALHPAAAFDAVTHSDRQHRQLGADLGRALTYPLLIFFLVFLGTIFFCLYLLPKMRLIYDDLHLSETFSISVVQWLREWMFAWVIVVPLIALALVFLWRRYIHRARWNWLVGSRRYFDLLDGAHRADQTASLIESGCTPGDATAVAVPASLSVRLPLLNWALGDGVDPDSQVVELRTVARLYRGFAQRRARVWRYAIPSLIGVLLGGVCVLAYGLILFLPLTRLLQSLGMVVV